MKKYSYEEAYEKLKMILNNMEKEDISLQDSLDLYKEGIQLYKICFEKLENAKFEMIKISDEIKDFIQEEKNEIWRKNAEWKKIYRRKFN